MAVESITWCLQAEEFAAAFVQDQGLTAAGARTQVQSDVADAVRSSSHLAAAADLGSPAADAGPAAGSTAASDAATAPQASADAAEPAAWVEGEDDDRDSCSPEELAAAVAASGAWSRVVRLVQC